MRDSINELLGNVDGWGNFPRKKYIHQPSPLASPKVPGTTNPKKHIITGFVFLGYINSGKSSPPSKHGQICLFVGGDWIFDRYINSTSNLPNKYDLYRWSSGVKNRCHHSAPQIAREFMVQRNLGKLVTYGTNISHPRKGKPIFLTTFERDVSGQFIINP